MDGMSCELAVKVTPRSRRNVIEIHDGVVKVWVTAPPVDGAANEAVRKLLAKRLSLAPSKVQLLRGDTSREKVFSVDGMSLDDAFIALESTIF
jgi:uncharacterized protein YggU (UPF0235/DUF167 family)